MSLDSTEPFSTSDAIDFGIRLDHLARMGLRHDVLVVLLHRLLKIGHGELLLDILFCWGPASFHLIPPVVHYICEIAGGDFVVLECSIVNMQITPNMPH